MKKNSARNWFRKYKTVIIFCIMYILEILVLFLDYRGAKSFFDINIYFLIVAVLFLIAMGIVLRYKNRRFDTGIIQISVLVAIFLGIDLLFIIMKYLRISLFATITDAADIVNMIIFVGSWFVPKLYNKILEKYFTPIYYEIFTKLNFDDNLQDYSYSPDIVLPLKKQLVFRIKNNTKDAVNLKYIGLTEEQNIENKEMLKEILDKGSKAKNIFNETISQKKDFYLEQQEQTSKISIDLEKYIKTNVRSSNLEWLDLVILYKIKDHLIGQQIYMHLSNNFKS